MLISVPAIGIGLAALSSLVLAGVTAVRTGRAALRWSFVLGMVAFAVESLANLGLLTWTELPEDRLFWLQVSGVSGLVLVLPWLTFAALLAHPQDVLPRGWRFGLTAIAAVAVTSAAALVTMGGFQVSSSPGPFYAVRLNPAGSGAVILQLLATVGILAGMELALRTAGRDKWWRAKYLILGLSAIFLARFYFLSQALLFHVVLAAYLTTQAAALVVGNLLIGASLSRDALRKTELTVSHRMLYRSVLAGVLGLYLFVVGGLGWLLNNLGFPEELLWGSLVAFVAVLGLAVVLLSEDARWRIKRFLSLHFYRSKYDYRERWITFTTRLGSLLALDDLAPQLLSAVTDAVGTAKGLLYLAESPPGRHHLAASSEITRPVPTLDAESPLLARLRSERRPILIEATPEIPALFAEGGIAVPLYWRDTLTGVMLIGPERAGASYTSEDFEFLETVGKQLAATILTARLSETLAQSREFEAFHRLTSFVVHDLKNSVSALSMLSQNALSNFDDPEFQRDALRTLSSSVDRMKKLLARLAAPQSAALQLRPVDLSAIALEALRPVAGRDLNIIKELAAVPFVEADPDALLRVFQNLITNAVEALAGRDGVLTVRTYQDGEWVAVSVTDTGCGMSEEFIRTSLFVPFRSTKNAGWGIGLYHAKGIVEAHRGTLEVSSKEGMGAIFTVRLPVASR
jgi:putative PEP-CTERM system histidine kinase